MKNIMTLPKIETPKYHLTLPSNQETVEFRPFLVKEEKVLMIAQEAGSDFTMISAMKDVITSCTFNKLDLYSIPMSDIEYVLLQIRAKSVGETSKLKFKCAETNEFVSVEIDLSKIEVKGYEEKLDNNIQLTDDVGITVKSPGLKDAEKQSRGKKQSDAESMLANLRAVIESVYDSDTVYPFSDVSVKEADTFIESLSSDQVSKIKDWVEKLPVLKHEIQFKGPKGHDNTIVLRGLGDFFH